MAHQSELACSKGANVSKKRFSNTAERIYSRQTQELVVGLCGFVGSGISTLGKKIENIFFEYGYISKYIKVSKIIEKIKGGVPEKDLGARIVALQEAGLILRKEEGGEVLALHVIEEIKKNRAEERYNIFGDTVRAVDDDSEDHNIRVVTIIDNIKHVDELNLLRAVYGDMFFLIGVVCPEEERLNRLEINKHIKSSRAAEIVERDKKDRDILGVQVSKVLCEADFFIANTKDHIQSVEPNIRRFVDLILGVNVHTPTKAEFAMCCAQVSAVRSACVSKQVGAAIVTREGEIISLGRNDVPKYGGGLYTCDDKTNDNRCAFRYNSKCKNSEFKDYIMRDIESNLVDILGADKAREAASIVSEMERIKGLTEFSRSIHAEMDAITTVARINANKLVGSTLFCTTFPCHNCARHIVASGIRQVYYIEPYDKSLAFELHDDAIRIDKPSGESPGYLRINQFEGVAPRVFLSLFKAGERKSLGSAIQIDPKLAKPKRRKQIDRFIEYEEVALEQLHAESDINSREPDPAG